MKKPGTLHVLKFSRYLKVPLGHRNSVSVSDSIGLPVGTPLIVIRRDLWATRPVYHVLTPYGVGMIDCFQLDTPETP